MKRDVKQRQSRDITRQIAEAQRQGDLETVQALFMQKVELNRELTGIGISQDGLKKE